MPTTTKIQQQSHSAQFQPLFVAVLAALAVLGLWASAFQGLVVVWGLLAACAAVLVWLYPHQALLLTIPLLFLEHDVFSLALPFGRLRAYHLLLAVLTARLAWNVARGQRTWRRTPLDLPLVVFLALSALAVLWSPDQAVALKILGLEVLLAALYWLVVNDVRTVARVEQVVHWFLGSAAVVALLGLLQTAANWLNTTFDWQLWTGPTIHSDILPFGRPYGTFVEPDWYGAIAMVALVLAASYALARRTKHQIGYLVLTLLFSTALVLSVVRGAWAGLIVAAIVLVLVNRKRQLLNLRSLVPAGIGLVLAVVMIAAFVPSVVSSVVTRAASLTKVATVLNEPRYLVVEEGIELWLRTPQSILIGHGPGAFNVLGSVPFVEPIQQIVQKLVPFQTNAVVNVLIDVGLAGLALMVWLVVRLVRTIRRALASVDERLAVPLLGLSAAFAGLALTYQVTTGLWLALTWFVLGLAVAVALVGSTPTNAHNHVS